jgi:hypothetical protein
VGIAGEEGNVVDLVVGDMGEKAVPVGLVSVPSYLSVKS